MTTSRRGHWTRAKRATFGVLTVLIAISLCMLIGETIARAFVAPHHLPAAPSPRTIDPYRANPYIAGIRPYLQVFIPGSRYTSARANFAIDYRINASGFRGPEIRPKEKNGLKRLLVIGDSIVEGHGVGFTETFVHKLGKSLNPNGWESVNAGMPGASPIYYACNLERYLALEPDAVLIVLFENDIKDDRSQELVYFGLPYLDDVEELLPGVNRFPPTESLRISTLLKRVWRKISKTPVERTIQQNRDEYSPNDEQKSIDAVTPFLVAPSQFDAQWRMTQSYLDHVVERLTAHGVQVLVANLSLGTVYPGNQEDLLTHADTLNEKVTDWAQQTAKLPFVSLLPAMIKAFTEHGHSHIMIPDDGHPTQKTHEILAAALYPWLIRHIKDAPKSSPREFVVFEKP